jgi:hypothetical protein
MAWPREHVEAALTAIRDSNMAVFGVEAWLANYWGVFEGNTIRLVKREGSWYGLIPIPDSDANIIGDSNTRIWSFGANGRSPDETWPDYCARTFEETLSEIRSWTVEENTHPDLRAAICFNLSFEGECGMVG